MKTAFLDAITSVHMVEEIGTFMADPPFTMFFNDKVTLHPHSRFLSKVSSDFHLNQSTHLPVFFLKLHSFSTGILFPYPGRQKGLLLV